MRASSSALKRQHASARGPGCRRVARARARADRRGRARPPPASRCCRSRSRSASRPPNRPCMPRRISRRSARVGARAHQDVVGELLQDVGRGEFGPERILGAVPARVAARTRSAYAGSRVRTRDPRQALSSLERVEPVRGADGRDQAHPARPLQRDESERGQEHEPRHQLAGRESGERRRATRATGRTAGAARPTPARSTTGIAVRPARS